MYRKNQLKEELDRLRKENRWLENENTYLKEKINTLRTEIHAKNVELQLENLSNKLVESVLKQPHIVAVGSDGWKPMPNANPITVTVKPEDLGIKIPVDTKEKDNDD